MNRGNARSERTAFAASFGLHLAFAAAFVANLPPRQPAAEPPVRVLLATRAAPAPAAAHEAPHAPSPAARSTAASRPLPRALPATTISTAASASPAIRTIDAPVPPAAAGDRENAPATPATDSSSTGVPTPLALQASSPVFDASYLENPAPPYPRAARRGGLEGRVVLRVHVNPAGTADEVLVRTSSGHDSLDEAARATVARWRFAPARRGDIPVAAWVLVPVSFRLDT